MCGSYSWRLTFGYLIPFATENTRWCATTVSLFNWCTYPCLFGWCNCWAVKFVHLGQNSPFRDIASYLSFQCVLVHWISTAEQLYEHVVITYGRTIKVQLTARAASSLLQKIFWCLYHERWLMTFKHCNLISLFRPCKYCRAALWTRCCSLLQKLYWYLYQKHWLTTFTHCNLISLFVHVSTAEQLYEHTVVPYTNSFP